MNQVPENIIPYVVERDPRGERTYDIYSLLLKERIVFLGTGINDQVANAIIAQLLFLDREDPERDINLYINSPGGGDTLFEVSSTYLARAKEIEIKLLERERNTKIESGDELKKFRTGELRSFIELCKSAQNQGSRRITVALSELNLKEN